MHINVTRSTFYSTHTNLKSFTTTYRKVITILATEKRLIKMLLICNLLSACIVATEPVIIGYMIDNLIKLEKNIYIWRNVILPLFVWSTLAVVGISTGLFVALHADRLAHRCRLGAISLFFEHALTLPTTFHDISHTGHLLKIMVTGSDQLYWVILPLIRDHFVTIAITLLLIPLSIFINWRLGMLLVFLATFFSIIAALVSLRTYHTQSQIEKQYSQLIVQIADAFSNMKVIHSFYIKEIELARVKYFINCLLLKQYTVIFWWALAIIITKLSSVLTILLIFIMGTHLYIERLATVGNIVTFMGFAMMSITRLEQAVSFFGRLGLQVPALTDFFRIIDTAPAAWSAENAKLLINVRGDVAFRGVSFAYDGSRPAVRDLTFEVQSGQIVALVGATGAGKSTAMDLLIRLADPQDGQIYVDDHHIRDIEPACLRRAIGVVFQDPLLFHRSIADNLRVGRSDATDEELVAAAKGADAHEFIMALPERYQTMLGERGAGLSGGERQRLAIARALVRNPSILVLDEATSALDAETESRIQQALNSLMKGRTTFVIAHRLSTVRNANIILVFDQGKIVEQGKYQDLVAKQGVFAHLVSRQLLNA